MDKPTHFVRVIDKLGNVKQIPFTYYPTDEDLVEIIENSYEKFSDQHRLVFGGVSNSAIVEIKTGEIVESNFHENFEMTWKRKKILP